MEFRVLGPLEVRRDGVAVELRGSKRRAVLALLVLHANEVVRTERLIEDLWGEDRPANAAAALHNHVSRLRKELGGDVLVTKPWGYVLRAGADEIDLACFERLVAEAKPLAARERAALLAEALGLWRGPALADLAHEPALAAESARLDELRLAALEQRLDADLELGRGEELVGELEALVAEHPLRERLRGQLILALYRSGRQAEALETYRETRRVLVEELGIEPGPELRELERAILRQDPSLASAPAAMETSPAPAAPARWRWPRSPLVVAAAALLLAGGGVAVAVVATRGGDARKEQAAPAARSSAPSSLTLVRAPRPRPRTKTTSRTRHVARHTRPAAKPRESAPTSARTTTVLVERAVPPPTTTRRQPNRPKPAAPAKPAATPTTTSKRAPTTTAKRPSPPPEVYWLTDDFTDPAMDFGLWHLATDGHDDVEAVERNGQLELWVNPDAVPVGSFFNTHYGTQCSLIGDFDARVEFKLLAWPPGDGVEVQLGAYFNGDTQGTFIGRGGAGSPGGGGFESYSTGIRAYGNGVQTADTSGALRIARERGILSTYYRYRDRWVLLASAPTTKAAHILLTLTANGASFGRQPAGAAFDNFEATAENVECLGVPRPPRKPR